MEPDPYSLPLKRFAKLVFRGLVKNYFNEQFACIETGDDNAKSPNPTIPTVGCILHLGKAFRPSLWKVFHRAFTVPCTSKQDFVAYVVSFCELFLRDGFPHLNRKMGVGNVSYFGLLMTCAITAELLYFCMDQDCYAFIASTRECLLVVYERFLWRQFQEAGGWEGLTEFCEDSIAVYESLPNETSGRVMGEPKYSMLVTDIRNRIEECVVCSGRAVVLSEDELDLIGEFDTSFDSGSCSVCSWTCNWQMQLFVNEYDADEYTEPSFNEGSP